MEGTGTTKQGPTASSDSPSDLMSSSKIPDSQNSFYDHFILLFGVSITLRAVTGPLIHPLQGTALSLVKTPGLSFSLGLRPFLEACQKQQVDLHTTELCT